MTWEQTLLKWILLLSGLFLMTAFAATCLPVSWMAATHQWLGLDRFPNRPVTIYLARSTALLYGVHGFLMFYTANTIESHWRFVKIFGWLHILMGTSMLLIDLTSPMPWYWIALEGPPVAILGVVILVLVKRAGTSWKDIATTVKPEI